jgi:Ca2+/Na+ antiporter
MIDIILTIIFLSLYVIFEVYYFSHKRKRENQKTKNHIKINEFELQKKDELILNLKKHLGV